MEVLIIIFLILLKEYIYASEKLVCVKANDTVTLECPRLEIDPVWRGPAGSQLYSIGTSVNKNLGIKDRLEVVEIMSPPQLNLQIKSFTLNDQGHYQCVGGDSDQVLHDYDFLVQIAKNSTELTIKNEEEDNTVRGFINETLELTCTVAVENFAVTLKWETNNRTLLFDADELVVYRFKPQLDDHLNIYTCIAKYNCTEKPFTKSVKIFLYLKPKVEIREGSKIEVLEGSKLTMECNYSSNHNITGLSWKYSKTEDGFQEVISVDHVFFNFNKITRNHSGKYACVVENLAGFTKAEILVSVKYPPTAYIIFNATDSEEFLMCIPNGNPVNYTFYKWEYMSNYMEHIRYLDGDQYGTLILERHKDHTSRHNGVYVCRLSNGISVNGNQIVSTKYALNFTGKPFFIKSNNYTQYGSIQEMVTVFADVVMDPNDQANITVMNSSMLPIRFNYKEMPVTTHDTVYGQNITVDATRISIWFELKDKDAFQTYTILATNNYGSSHFKVNVKAASSPMAPVILKTFVRQTDVLVNWQPSFDGGFTQHFYIQYRKTTVPQWTDVSVRNKTSTIVYGLEPNTEYYIRMYAQNKLGLSNRSEQFMFKTDPARVIQNQMFLFMVIVIVVLAVLLVCTCTFIGLWTKCNFITCREGQNVDTDSDGHQYDEVDDRHLPFIENNPRLQTAIIDSTETEMEIQNHCSNEERLIADNAVNQVETHICFSEVEGIFNTPRSKESSISTHSGDTSYINVINPYIELQPIRNRPYSLHEYEKIAHATETVEIGIPSESVCKKQSCAKRFTI